MTVLQKAPAGVSRRWVLKAAPTAAAGLMLYSCAPEAVASGKNQRLNPFVEFTADGRIIITSPEAEMGQDIFTGLAKVLADEIGLDWDSVDVARAPHHKDYYPPFGGQSTGGSRSMRTWYKPFRELSARIRVAFLQAAAGRWDVPISDLSLVASEVRSQSATKSIALTELLDDVIKAELPESAPLKPDSALTLIGKDVSRKDITGKVTGAAQYGADVRLPGMLYASIAVIPNATEIGAPSWDAVKAVPGFVAGETFGSSVAVVGNTWWAANTALKELDVRALAIAEDDQIADADVDKTLQDAVAKAGPHLHAETASKRVIRSAYQVPFLSHMCMETMTATAHVKDGKVKVWAPVQSPTRFAQRAADVLKIDLADVTLENTFLGGGFGRKATDLRALELAVRLSAKMKAPVQVMMNKEADIVSDQYRPAARFELSAEIGDDGAVTDIRSSTATQSIAKARLPQFYKKGRPEFPEQGIFPYEAAKADHRWEEIDLPVAIGFWRSVNGTSFPFAGESFTDELAYLAGEDPLAFRLSRITQHPRMHAVLKRVGEMANWSKPRPEGTGLGVGVFEEWGSVAAQVAEVSVANDTLTIHKIWAAVDCGRVVSPDTVRAQTESGIHCGLSAALMGKITLENGQATQSNFDTYPVMDLTRSPEIEVALMDSDLPPGGVGEIGTPATAPAVTNAIFAAIGKRIRTLPINLHMGV